MWWCVKVCGPRVMGGRLKVGLGHTPASGDLCLAACRHGARRKTHQARPTTALQQPCEGDFWPHHTSQPLCICEHDASVLSAPHKTVPPSLLSLGQHSRPPPRHLKKPAHHLLCCTHPRTHTPSKTAPQPSTSPAVLHRSTHVCAYAHTHTLHTAVLHTSMHVCAYAHTHTLQAVPQPSTAPAVLHTHTHTHTLRCPPAIPHTAIRLTLTTMPSWGSSG